VGPTPLGRRFQFPRKAWTHEKFIREGDKMKGWTVFLLGLLLVGCASVRDVQILDKDIDRLQYKVNTLQKELSDLTLENQKLKADTLLQIENFKSELRTLSTGVEEYKEYLKRTPKESDRMKSDMEARLKSIEDREKSQEDKIKELEDRLKGMEGKVSASSQEGLPELKGVSTGMGDLYKDAYDTFYRGDMNEARKKFEAFLKQYPNTSLSGNAQFWIGETYYQKKEYEKAILEYEKVMDRYPEGDKVPAALYKQALAFLEVGDKSNAKNMLKRVIEKYPHSIQAEAAKKKLESLK
jgi:tol-pal system protein YbgF